jgi:hypothetical protein
MTPVEFANKYLDMDVYMYPLQEAGGGISKSSMVSEPGWKGLSVAKYRLGHSAWAQVLWRDIKPNFKNPVNCTVETIDGATREVRLTASQAWRHFYYPFVGKGSPEQAQIAIQLTYRFHKSVFSPEAFVTKDFIGLDCNGFVGNYIQRVIEGTDWLHADNDKDPGPTTLMTDLIQRQGKKNQINDVEELEGDDTFLLCYCEKNGKVIDPQKDKPGTYGHVMITEPGTVKMTPNGAEFGVVESAGRTGLLNSTYSVTNVTKGQFGTVFTCYRKAMKSELPVRIARLDM